MEKKKAAPAAKAERPGKRHGPLPLFLVQLLMNGGVVFGLYSLLKNSTEALEAKTRIGRSIEKLAEELEAKALGR